MRRLLTTPVFHIWVAALSAAVCSTSADATALTEANGKPDLQAPTDGTPALEVNILTGFFKAAALPLQTIRHVSQCPYGLALLVPIAAVIFLVFFCAMSLKGPKTLLAHGRVRSLAAGGADPCELPEGDKDQHPPSVSSSSPYRLQLHALQPSSKDASCLNRKEQYSVKLACHQLKNTLKGLDQLETKLKTLKSSCRSLAEQLQTLESATGEENFDSRTIEKLLKERHEELLQTEKHLGEERARLSRLGWTTKQEGLSLLLRARCFVQGRHLTAAAGRALVARDVILGEQAAEISVLSGKDHFLIRLFVKHVNSEAKTCQISIENATQSTVDVIIRARRAQRELEALEVQLNVLGLTEFVETVKQHQHELQTALDKEAARRIPSILSPRERISVPPTTDSDVFASRRSARSSITQRQPVGFQHRVTVGRSRSFKHERPAQIDVSASMERWSSMDYIHLHDSERHSHHGVPSMRRPSLRGLHESIQNSRGRTRSGQLLDFHFTGGTRESRAQVSSGKHRDLTRSSSWNYPEGYTIRTRSEELLSAHARQSRARTSLHLPSHAAAEYFQHVFPTQSERPTPRVAFYGSRQTSSIERLPPRSPTHTPSAPFQLMQRFPHNPTPGHPRAPSRELIEQPREQHRVSFSAEARPQPKQQLGQPVPTPIPGTTLQSGGGSQHTTVADPPSSLTTPQLESAAELSPSSTSSGMTSVSLHEQVSVTGAGSSPRTEAPETGNRETPSAFPPKPYSHTVGSNSESGKAAVESGQVTQPTIKSSLLKDELSAEVVSSSFHEPEAALGTKSLTPSESPSPSSEVLSSGQESPSRRPVESSNVASEAASGGDISPPLSPAESRQSRGPTFSVTSLLASSQGTFPLKGSSSDLSEIREPPGSAKPSSRTPDELPEVPLDNATITSAETSSGSGPSPLASAPCSQQPPRLDSLSSEEQLQEPPRQDMQFEEGAPPPDGQSLTEAESSDSLSQATSEQVAEMTRKLWDFSMPADVVASSLKYDAALLPIAGGLFTEGLELLNEVAQFSVDFEMNPRLVIDFELSRHYCRHVCASLRYGCQRWKEELEKLVGAMNSAVQLSKDFRREFDGKSPSFSFLDQAEVLWALVKATRGLSKHMSKFGASFLDSNELSRLLHEADSAASAGHTEVSEAAEFCAASWTTLLQHEHSPAASGSPVGEEESELRHRLPDEAKDFAQAPSVGEVLVEGRFLVERLIALVGPKQEVMKLSAAVEEREAATEFR